MCAYWAKRGECRKNPNYMLKSCKQSCARYGGHRQSRGHCRDKLSNCRNLRHWCHGHRYSSYMATYCKKTCNKC